MFELAERLAAAGRALHRGRRRPAGRHRRHGVAGLDCMAFSLFGAALRASCRSSASTRGRCFAGNAALLGCCDVVIATRELEHRHGRPGDDRGRRPRRVPARGDRPDDGAGAERRRRRRRSRTRPRRCASAKQYLVVLPGPARATGRAPTSGCCARVDPREPAARLRRARGDRDARRHRLGARAAAALRRRHGHRARPHRGPAARRRSPTTRCTSPARSTATAPTRRRASCSSATRSTSRSCSCATRPASWSGPEVEKTALVRHCSPHVRHRREPDRAVLHDRAAQGLRPRRAGDGRRQLQGAALHASRGRPASSAAWASRAR